MTKRFEAIAGSILFALILIVSINIGGDALDRALTPKIAAMPESAMPESAATESAQSPPEQSAQAPAAEPAPAAPAPADIADIAPEPIAPLVAKASAEDGQAAAKPCTACHTFDDGGPNRVGPNLHGVIGRDIASKEGFSYSQALSALPGDWTYEKLDAFLTNPKKAVPGTKMGFAGFKDAETRAKVIAYLKSLSPNAPPLE